MSTPKRRQAFTLVEALVSLAVFSIIMGIAGPLVHRFQQVSEQANRHAQHEEFIARASTMLRESVRSTDAGKWAVSPNRAQFGDRECRLESNRLSFGIGADRFRPLLVPPDLTCVFTHEAGHASDARLVLTIHEGARLRARIVACGL